VRRPEQKSGGPRAKDFLQQAVQENALPWPAPERERRALSPESTLESHLTEGKQREQDIAEKILSLELKMFLSVPLLAQAWTRVAQGNHTSTPL